MIMALKGNCLQPINTKNSRSPQLQTLDFAVKAGLAPANTQLNTTTTRGDFFQYITQALAYKAAHPELLDTTLPGCGDGKAKIGNKVSIRYSTGGG